MYRELQEISPNYGSLAEYVGYNYLMTGEFEKINLNAIQATHIKAYFECVIAAKKGDKKASNEKLESYKRSMPKNGDANYLLATVHCFRNEYDLALDYIEKSYEAHEATLSWCIKVEPPFDPIHNDPRFVAVLRKFD